MSAVPFSTDLAYLLLLMLQNTNGPVILATDATAALLAILESIPDCIKDGHVVFNTYWVQSAISSDKQLYFVDLSNKLCSCLHFQMFHYCAHLLHVAMVHKTPEVEEFVRQDMDTCMLKSVNLDSWRRVGREDDSSHGIIWKTVNVASDCGADLITDAVEETKLCTIGDSVLDDIKRGMSTLSRDDRIVISKQLESVLDTIASKQKALTLSTVPSELHNGTRQPTDRRVTALFPDRRSTKRPRSDQNEEKDASSMAADLTIPQLIAPAKTKRAKLPTAMSQSTNDSDQSAARSVRTMMKKNRKHKKNR